MPLINLSTLEGAELRRLLDSARRQGQAAQTYEILQEMEARRHRGPRPKTPSLKRPRRQPRMISLEFGDPLDRTEDALLDDVTDDLPPLTLGDVPPREAPPTPPAQKSPGWAHWGALIFALGLAGGVAAGWWAAGFAGGGAPHAAIAQAAPPKPTVQIATLPPAAPPAEPEPPASLIPEPSSVPPAADSTTAPAAAASETPETANTSPVQSPADAPACSSEATPADRTICADPTLRGLQTELRGAYAEALNAHQDRALLRERQLAWRDARNGVSDPQQLAGLYRERIGKLRAATADALRRR